VSKDALTAKGICVGLNYIQASPWKVPRMLPQHPRLCRVPSLTVVPSLSVLALDWLAQQPELIHRCWAKDSWTNKVAACSGRQRQTSNDKTSQGQPPPNSRTMGAEGPIPVGGKKDARPTPMSA